MPAVKVHTDQLAAAFVDQAARILGVEGPAALTLRRLAAEVGTSTMAVYTLFGDKPALLAAMHEAGFERLRAALSKAGRTSPDPLTALAAQGVAYRRTALANRHLYGLMFGNSGGGELTPSAEGRVTAEASYASLVVGVQRCLDAGQLGGATAEQIARHLWAVSHGFVSLEIAGQIKGTAKDRVKAHGDSLVYSTAAFLR